MQWKLLNALFSSTFGSILPEFLTIMISHSVKEKKKILLGGQAVIEGVMMRSPDSYVVALRRRTGEIEIKKENFLSFLESHPQYNIPIIRGIISLVEILKIGIKTLQYSADRAIEDIEAEEKSGGDAGEKGEASGEHSIPKSSPSIIENTTSGPDKKKESGTLILTMIVAFSLGIGFFFVLPLIISTKIFAIERDALTFNIITGLIRIVFFILYLWGITFFKDIKRVFQYHGAEHKLVFTFEAGEDVSVSNSKKYSTYHPRCGTSFIVIVLIVSVLIFALLDTLLITIWGRIGLSIRLLTHIPLIPVVAGVSYEIIKLSSRKSESIIAKILTAPGLWLQRITTSEPDAEQLEVAAVALKNALGERYNELAGQKFEAETIH